MSVAALILGAGRGERLGTDAPKAFVSIAGRSLLVHTLRALAECPELETLVPVVAAPDLYRFEGCRAELAHLPRLTEPVPGGAARQDSMRAGLRTLPGTVRYVAVHDAARPFVSARDVARVVAAACETGAAILAVPVRDTLKRVREEAIVETLVRSECWAAQTPQVFRRDWLEQALEKAEAEGVTATDDAQLVERLGVRVRVVEGDPGNLKITFPADLELARARLEST